MRINLDSPILRTLSTIFDVIVTTVIFLIFCIPVISVGPALCALYTTMMDIANNSCSGVFRKFFESFRDNFKQGTIFGVIMTILGVVVYLNFGICFVLELEGTILLGIMRGITLFTTIFYGCLLIYIFPGVARFYVTSKQAFSNALVWTVQNPGYTALLLLLLIIMLLAAYLAWFMAIPVVAACIYYQARLLNKVFGLEETEVEVSAGEEKIQY